MSSNLYAGLVYPQFPLRCAGHKVFTSMYDRPVRQQNRKKILHGVQTCRGKVLLHNPFQFLQGQERRTRLLFPEQTLAFSGQRILLQPVFPGQSEKFAETAHILGQGILGKLAYRPQMHLKPIDKLPTQFMNVISSFL